MKLQPIIIKYRNYKHFQSDKFREKLLLGFCNVNAKSSNDELSDFTGVCCSKCSTRLQLGKRNTCGEITCFLEIKHFRRKY